MTIKNTNKNVSAENHEDVVVNASFENGILTLIRKNLYDDSIDPQKKINVDLSDHKLKLKVLNSKQELDTLESSTTEEDIKEKNSYIFLVPFENTGEEGVYREYIWVEEENDINGGEFEVIGSTKTDLEPYFKKADIVNNLTTIEAGKALDARQGKILNEKFGDYLTNALASSTYVTKETGKGLSTNDFTTEEKTKLEKCKESGTFTELKTLIDEASSEDTIVLDKDYINTDQINGIYISKNLTIIGNDHIIDTKGYPGLIVPSFKLSLNKICFIDTLNTILPFLSFTNLSVNSVKITDCSFVKQIPKLGLTCSSGQNDSIMMKNCLFVNTNINLNVLVKSYNCIYINSQHTNVINYDYLIEHQDITGKEDVLNKVTTVSSSSTNTQYPTALAVYNALQNVSGGTGGSGLSDQDLLDAESVISEYENPNLLLVCVKLKGQFAGDDYNLRINDEDNGWYTYLAERNDYPAGNPAIIWGDVSTCYFMMNNQNSLSDNYTIYLVYDGNNPETDTTTPIAQIDFANMKYTTDTEKDITSNMILIDYTAEALSPISGGLS